VIKNKPLRTDLAVVTALLVLGITGFFVVRNLSRKKQPCAIRIKTKAEEINLPLRDTSFSIDGPEGSTRITISEGKVWVAEASCPKKLCQKQGAISRPGETIVCLPNRIVITLEGKTPLDATTY